MAAKPMMSQFDFDVTITTTEMHTGGESVRIIESGYPVPQGKTILDKIQDLKDNYDDYRTFLMHEPRGHFDMYGVLLVTPDNPEADIGAIFMHNEGYSTMCGHACIALGRYAVDRGLIRRPVTCLQTQVNIQVPCGMVKAFVQVEPTPGKKSGRVRFESTPSFVVTTDQELQVDGVGKLKVDVTYGGAFYAFVDAADAGLEFGKNSLSEFVRVGTAIKKSCIKAVTLTHKSVPAFLYGVIFTESRTKPGDAPVPHLTIFADSQTDRSPTGSGVSARLALMHHRGLLGVGQKRVFLNPLNNSEFFGQVLWQSDMDGNKIIPKEEETTLKGKDAIASTESAAKEKGEAIATKESTEKGKEVASVEGVTAVSANESKAKAVVTEVEGQGYYSGKSTFHLERGDALGRGFLLR